MSIAHEPWSSEVDWSSEWRAMPKNLTPSNLLLPSARFTVFAVTAILAGAVLAFVT
jgi:hypothetical protein